MSFTLGQRWISDTENELGLGTIVAIEGRMVTLLFPATGENRFYAKDSAPITRVKFNVGDTITSHEGWQLEIDHVEEMDGLLTYIGTRLDSQTSDVSLREIFLDSKITFNNPQDRLFAGQIDKMARFALRFRAREHQSKQYSQAISGLRGIRANLIPHQLHIAHEVGKRHAPRVLLADEVGLGKTIEAGMIIHQQLQSGLAQRVLIIVPETLQHQWLVEMLRRFNLRFSLFDDARYSEALLESGNPFETEQLVICSLDFVVRHQDRLYDFTGGNWDLMIIDEAHHLVWDENEPSIEYLMVEQLTKHVPGVLLLTATPEQLGQQSHFARLRLLDPNRFHSYDAFVAEQAQYQPVADAVSLLTSEAPLSGDNKKTLSALIKEQNISELLAICNDENEAADKARQQLITLLMDRHGTSRVLFRNTRQGVAGFPLRALHTYPLTLPQQYKTAMKVAAMMNSQNTLDVQAHDSLYPEQIFQAIQGSNATWLAFDPRVTWLIDYLLAHRNEKVLIICANAETALQLEQGLREREGIRAAVFHEGLSIVERDRAAAYFASKEEGAQVLLCSEIGSEGRNFQFANQLVMFDLPFNPDLLEQRIGRLDRIGQLRDIDIHVPFLEDSAQQILVRWFHEGLNAFEQTCPTGRAVYDTHRDTLMNFLVNPAEQANLNAFISESRQQHDALKSQLEQGRDRLLEMNSNGGDKGESLADDIAAQDNDSELVNFTLNMLDIVGVSQEDHSDKMLVLTPSDHMLVPDFPGIPEEGCTVTFSRERALSREDAQFLSWEHPIVRNGLDLILSDDIGSCAVSILKNKALPVGTLFLELLYVVEAQAPKHLQLTRFLPATPIRLLLDAKGNNIAPQVPFEGFNRQLSPLSRITAAKMVSAVQQDIHTQLQQAKALVDLQAKECIEQAKLHAETQITHELERLTALKAVNPNIREDEITTLQENKTQVIESLNAASWRLDAIRLIVVSHQ